MAEGNSETTSELAKPTDEEEASSLPGSDGAVPVGAIMGRPKLEYVWWFRD